MANQLPPPVSPPTTFKKILTLPQTCDMIYAR
uniref:Uncharacterized protein n=1 Tax=Siphoviridae sp. ctzyE57 TaxID=2827982 RepID=A0A8S5SGI8_9CAUD|nr:MAG TPA: hypothetical protein [Siphoviridae sp. ctzyE57]